MAPALALISTNFTSWCYLRIMKRSTITLPDDLAADLHAWTLRQDAEPTLTAVVQAALREYLARRGATRPVKPFHVTPARKGSGRRDVSRRHDEYLADNA